MSAELEFGGAEDGDVLARLERQTLEENYFIDPITHLDAVWDEILGEDYDLGKFTKVYKNHPVEFVDAIEHLLSSGRIAAQKIDRQTFWEPSGQGIAKEISELVGNCAKSLQGTWRAGKSLSKKAPYDEVCEVFSAFSKEHARYDGFIQGVSMHLAGLAVMTREMMVELFKDEAARDALQLMASQGDLNMIVYHAKKAAGVMFEIGIPKKS